MENLLRQTRHAVLGNARVPGTFGGSPTVGKRADLGRRDRRRRDATFGLRLVCVQGRRDNGIQLKKQQRDRSEGRYGIHLDRTKTIERVDKIRRSNRVGVLEQGIRARHTHYERTLGRAWQWTVCTLRNQGSFVHIVRNAGGKTLFGENPGGHGIRRIHGLCGGCIAQIRLRIVFENRLRSRTYLEIERRVLQDGRDACVDIGDPSHTFELQHSEYQRNEDNHRPYVSELVHV